MIKTRMLKAREITFKLNHLFSIFPKVFDFESLVFVIRQLADEASWFVSIYTNARASSKLSKNAAACKRRLYKKGQ